MKDAFKSLKEYLDKQDVKASGPPITDLHPDWMHRLLLSGRGAGDASAPEEAPTGNISVGPAPGGKALKFVHRGSYDAMDLDGTKRSPIISTRSNLEAKDLFIEEYATDPLKTDPPIW